MPVARSRLLCLRWDAVYRSKQTESREGCNLTTKDRPPNKTAKWLRFLARHGDDDPQRGAWPASSPRQAFHFRCGGQLGAGPYQKRRAFGSI
jgi:hypothetical protein